MKHEPLVGSWSDATQTNVPSYINPPPALFLTYISKEVVSVSQPTMLKSTSSLDLVKFISEDMETVGKNTCNSHKTSLHQLPFGEATFNSIYFQWLWSCLIPQLTCWNPKQMNRFATFCFGGGVFGVSLNPFPIFSSGNSDHLTAR